jgi:transposase
VLRGRDVQDIEELKRQGLSIRAISGLTGYDRKTIRKYLIQPESAPVYGPRPAAPSKLDAFKPYLDERLLTNSYLVGAQNWAQLTLTAAQP